MKDKPRTCLPAAPPKDVSKTQTPAKQHTVQGYPGWAQRPNGSWVPVSRESDDMRKTQEELEMHRAYEDREPLFSRSETSNYPYNHRPVNNNTPSVPKTHYVASATFRYPHWRRIEDVRTVYSMSGIKLGEAKKYRVELVKHIEDDAEKKEALTELVDATIEYGFIAPEPCVERWLDTEDEHLINLQHLRIDLYNLFQEHSLLDHGEYKERKFIWDYLEGESNGITQTLELIQELMTTYKYGMFDPERKVRYTYTRKGKKKKKKELTKQIKSSKVAAKEEAKHATVH